MRYPCDLPSRDIGDAARKLRSQRVTVFPLVRILTRLALGGLLLSGPAANAIADDNDSKNPATQQNTPLGSTARTEEDRRYGDWELVCNPRMDPETKKADSSTCRLQQAQAVNGGKDIVFLFNITKLGKQRVAIISTPLNVYLPAGLELKIDNGQMQRVIFETCNISGCHAGFALNGQLLGALRKGKVLTVELKDTKATTIPLTVSLNGISAGIDALDAVVP